MKDRERYIGGPTGGIPEVVFQKTGLTKELISGKSGKAKLQCTIQPNFLEIEDFHEPKLHFLAFIEKGTLISFSVRNLGWLGDSQQKHPDIYPFLLLQASISYFNQNGYSIEGISAYWKGNGSLTENYRQYWKYLRDLGKTDFTSDDHKAAAQNTKTGEMARRLNFPVVDDPKHLRHGQVITTVFRRESAQ